MKRPSLIAILFAIAAFIPHGTAAQNVGIKTNLLYDALANINLGIEVKMAPRWTFDANGNFNDWTFS
ncbi:MAG: DUF3575 domain-containing protein, partial [Muribaculaceae bacterium]|nr:DUF3575 domain-containing protein [Muribaculaceae bacterium]